MDWQKIIDNAIASFNRLKIVAGIQNPYKQFEYTIASGEAETLYYNFNFFRIISLTNATGVTIRFGSSGTPTDVVGAGIGYKLPDTVDRAQIFNGSGGPITIVVAVAIGDIFDDRLNISGNIQVINAPDTCLQITNCEVDEVAVPLLVEDEALAALMVANTAMMQNDEDQRSALTTLDGATFTSVTNATTEIVSAAANTAGVIIRHAECAAVSATTLSANLRVNGNTLLIASGTNGEYNMVTIKDITVPAGVAISAVCGLACTVTIWYEVL